MNAHMNTSLAADLLTYVDSEWLSARELIGLKLNELPSTERAIQIMATREGWRNLGSTKARKRKGRGGGWEYHISCLPSAVQADWTRRQKTTDLTVKAKADKVAIAEAPESIDARRREIMEARAAVVLDIERRAILIGSASKAIPEFIAESKAGVLPELMAATVKLAMEKGRGLTPSRPTLYNWRRAYLDGGVNALIPEKRAQETKQDHPIWLSGFLRFYARPQKPTIAQALDNYCETLAVSQDAPSYYQVRRALKALQGTTNYMAAFKGREGPLALKARLAFVTRTVEGMEPGTIYTSDGKTFDAEVQNPKHGKPFKPEITTVLDVVTKKVVGWSVGLDENAELTADALRHACEEDGIPAVFYTDLGKGFKNKRISKTAASLCARLGITPTNSIAQNSQARGLIERVQGTIWNRLSKEYPSYMGKDMDREAAQKYFRASRKNLQIFEREKSIQDSKTGQKALAKYSKLVVSWSQFLDDVAEAVDEYNNTAHSSLKLRDPENGRMRSASPNEIWTQFEANGFEPFLLETNETDDLFRPYEKRKTRRALVDWLGNKYFSNDLEKYHEQYVFVGYDIHNADRIWVREIDLLDGEEAPGALICTAEFGGNDQRYIPLTFEQKSIETRAKGRTRRLTKKLEEVAAEAQPQIAAEVPVTLNFATRPPIDQAVVEAEIIPIAEPTPITPSTSRDVRNPWGNPDIDLAWQIVESPVGTEIPVGWVRLMTNLMNNHASVDMMKEVELPLWELKERIEAAPQPLNKSSNTGASNT